MTVPEMTIAVVREWVEKADNDLKIASHALTLEDDCPADAVCFHAQQCVEKYLKALLTLRSQASPKIHDIRALIKLLPRNLRPEIEPATRDRLTEYATVTRYPGDYEPIPLSEARLAVKTARQVRSKIRKLLPPETLRCPKKQGQRGY